ncbi:MAG: LysR family transcriptional regulator [Pseudomonadota bacterium]
MQNWDDLRIYLAVAEHGSTKAAAGAIGVNATTLGRRIKALEAELGLALFDRDTRGYRLTAEGQDLLARAETVAAAVEDFSQFAERQRRLDTGTIRITAPEIAFNDVLAEIISAFTSEHPGLRFTFVSGDHIVDLESGAADIAFRGVKTPENDRLIGRRLRGHKWTVYASSEATCAPTSPEELFDHPVAIYTGNMEALCPHQWFLERIDRSKIVAECSTHANMRAVIKSGAAVGLLAVSHTHSQAELTPCFPPRAETYTNFWLLASPAAYRRTAVRRFLQFAATRYNAVLDRLQGPE